MREKVAVAIKTGFRKDGVNYLEETVANMKRAGVFESKHLHSVHVVNTSDHSSWYLLPEGCEADHHVPVGKRTLHQNASEAIRIASHTNADWALVLEDDLDFCDDFLDGTLRWVKDVEATNPWFRMYVLGANYAQINHQVQRGVNHWRYPVSAFYGAQALLWRRDTARALAAWLGPDPSYKGVRDHGHDLLLQRWASELGESFFCASAPSFVQHIGRQSGIDNRFFEFTSWPGRSWRYGG